MRAAKYRQRPCAPFKRRVKRTRITNWFSITRRVSSAPNSASHLSTHSSLYINGSPLRRQSCDHRQQSPGRNRPRRQNRRSNVGRRGQAYIKQKYNKPGEVFLGTVHRLDRPVSGLVVFARTSKALTRLNEMFRRGDVHKTYHAIVPLISERPNCTWPTQVENSSPSPTFSPEMKSATKPLRTITKSPVPNARCWISDY